MFIFGWTSPNAVKPGGGSWVGPCSSGIPFGFGMVTIYFSANAYIIDAFPGYVASALAAKTVVRSGSGAAMPLFITAMYHNLGNGWAGSVWAFISLGMIPIPFLFLLALDEAVNCDLDTLPALVAVHGVVATDNGRDLADLLLVNERKQVLHVSRSGARGSVATIAKEVDVDLLEADFLGGLEQCVEVGYVRVHTTVGNLTKQSSKSRQRQRPGRYLQDRGGANGHCRSSPC